MSEGEAGQSTVRSERIDSARDSTELKLSPGTQNSLPTTLDRLEQIAKIMATVLVPVIIAVGGWVLQSTIENAKEAESRAVANAQREADKQKIALEYVKLAKDILTSQKDTPDVLVKWSWQLIDAESPRPFDAADFERVVASNVKIPITSSVDRIPESPISRRASTEALNLIIQEEVGSRSSYEQNFAHPRSYGDGVTLGIGYDLAYVSPDEFRSAWGGRLAPDDVTTLLPAIGVKDQTAVDELIRKMSSITVTWDQALSVFLNTTLAKTDTALRSKLMNIDALPPEAYGALLALVYNRGANFITAGDRYQEMRAIRADMEAKKFADIPLQIRAMKRLHSGPTQALALRLELEAALFEKGFETPASPAKQ